ncbi:hypothetical protein MUP95_02935 [bacterium]|nr:hypothetical protein [bacterium]
MTKKILHLPIYVLILFFLLMACDQGLMPPEILDINFKFIIPPQGGNPVGIWIPDTSKPVNITLINENKLPTFIDSLILETELDKNGIFSFSVSGLCSIRAILNIEPTVYIQGLASPLVLTMNDTLFSNGPYEILDDKILCLSMETTFSQLDTLGFTCWENSLELISLPNTFPVQGFDDIQFYYVIYLTRSMNKISQQYISIPVYLKNREGRT